MRELTFPGFLKSYVRELSLTHSTGVRVLTKEAAERNPRLREPLYLYALFTGQEVSLLKAVRGTKLFDDYERMKKCYDRTAMEKLLWEDSPELPVGYRKVWKSYAAYKGRGRRDNETKDLMRKEIIRLQAQYGISNYRLYTDLHLNPGNLNTWLKHGDGRKVSLKTARSVLEHARSVQ